MDWDEARARTKLSSGIGEDLSAVSIADLQDRAAALKAEIVRIEAAISAKRRQQDAAASIFKS